MTTVKVLERWRVEVPRSTSRAAAATWQQLPFSMQAQEQSNWCWAAVGVSVDQYYNPVTDTRQCTIATNQIGTACCVSPLPAGCNIPGYLGQALEQRGHLASTAGGGLSMKQIRAEIDDGRPVALRIAWTGGTSAHFVVLTGYQDDDHHLAVDDPGGGSRSIVDIDTFPSTYGGGGTWSHTYYTRNGPIVVEPVTAVPGSSVYGVSRSADKLDVFLTNKSGFVRTASWEPAFTDGFRGWRKILDGKATPGGPVTVISRSPDQLDIFVTGTDGHVYSAAWNPTHTDGWHGWWQVGDVTVPQGTHIHGVSRSADKLDIFVTDVDGVVRTASWEPAFPDGWRGWREINGGRAKPGAPVTAISRSPDQLDIFVTGTDGHVYSAAWHPSHTDGWHGWWQIGDVTVPQGTPVHGVSRTTNKLDIFVTDVNQVIRTASWEPAFEDGWRGWREINGGRAKPGAPVTAISRSDHQLDIFVTGLGGRVFSASWNPWHTDGWHGWWQISEVAVPDYAAVQPVVRLRNHLDVFFVGTDNNVHLASWSDDVAFGHWRG